MENYKEMLLKLLPLSHIQKVKKILLNLQQKVKKKKGSGSSLIVGLLADLMVKENVIKGEYDDSPLILENLLKKEDDKEYLEFNWNRGILECVVDKNRYASLPTKFHSDFIKSIALFHGLKNEFYISQREDKWYIIIKEGFSNEETFMKGFKGYMERERGNQEDYDAGVSYLKKFNRKYIVI